MIRTHTALTAVVVAAGLLLGGCGSDASGTPAVPVVADASKVDMCTILTDAELIALGIEPATHKPMDQLGIVGCRWLGKPFTLRLERDEETVAEYVARRDDPAFTIFRENAVNDRAGVQLSVRPNGDQCEQLIDGGSVSLAVSVALAFSLSPPKIDPCAEALRIAEMIEPRLPQGGE
ncbi:MAG TPA: DUF3558 domain-containing protein [Pseudonocardiaceae bacterium]|nr:DUF3558 domain-containing protein [Pseudonocardiaceae bacterium]